MGFQTNLYLLAFASNLLPSKNSVFMGTEYVRNMAFMIAGNIVESLGIRLVIKREKLEALGLTWPVK